MDNLVVLGRWLVIVGLSIASLGGLLWLLGRVPGLSQFPGTLRLEWPGVTCIFPLLGSIILSILLTLALNLLARLLNR